MTEARITDAELARSRAVPVPRLMCHLPIDPVRGIPVPWFVALIDGKPEFRVADGEKRVKAVMDQLCWLCGQRLTPPSVFVLGPISSLNRINSEPPCHPECAKYAALACPFLARPRMVRRDLPAAVKTDTSVDGVMIDRNPGCVALWMTKGYRVISDGGGNGGWLINVGDPFTVTWYSQGRPATRAEVLVSIVTGIAHLKMPEDPSVWEELARAWVILDGLLPKE